MGLRLISIGSSSAGNSYLITDGRTNLILDVGVSCKRITETLKASGIECADVHGIFITHEHADHVHSLRAAAKKMDCATVYSSRGTVCACDTFEYVPANRLSYISAQQEISMGDIKVKAFGLSHDAAEPINFSFSEGESRLTVVTDTGVVTDEIFEEVASSDMIVLEANHEKNILEMGPYPYKLKRRILGDFGHLSNDAAGDTLTRAICSRRSRLNPCGDGRAAGTSRGRIKILLAHLSTTNNTPDQARLTVGNILEEGELFSGRDFELGVASKSERSGAINV